MLTLQLFRALRTGSIACALGCLGPIRSAPSADLLELERGDHICLLGNTLAERMQHHGWLEAFLQSRFPEKELTVRNLGFSADELSVHQRTMNFGKFSDDELSLNLSASGFVPWDRYLSRCQADVVFAFFGYNESFAGSEGLEKFESDLEEFIEHIRGTTYNGRSAPRLVLFSSIPFEDLGDRNVTLGRENNARLELYTRATARVAGEHGVPFVDLYTPMRARYAAASEPLTINGIHLKESGNEVLAEVIESALFSGSPANRDAAEVEKIRRVVLEKNLLWFNHYRATDGYNVYGGRSREAYPRGRPDAVSNFLVLQREMDILDVMAAERDRRIWALAGGGDLEVDDSNAPPPIEVETNKPGPGRDGAHLFFRGEEARDKMTVAPGMKVELFADEKQFPVLVNPVQMAWDTRNRLWVAAWPTYPHWRPDRPMNDKLLILEDTDGDGRANTCTVFADDLHNPTGFEFWNGGVLVANCPDLLFLKDTDGDDVADVRERVLHGLSSGDTHHSANSFVLGPDGALYFQEGTFHQSQIETVHGPVRNHNGCVWRFDPRTWRVERYIPYNFANPHGHVFDRWGQDFVTDGTGNVNYYALAYSGHIAHPAKHGGYFPFFPQRSRPCAGTEILSSRHFPEENQGNYLIANVIGFQGIFQYRVLDDGSGFRAEEVDPIVQSTDLNFRPADIEVGPDGAIYFLDWHNPIIGHLQHHLRDPSRDATHGRVHRVTYEGRELLEPLKIAGRPIEELLDLLKEREDRVRYRTRIELSGRDSDRVVSAARAWVAGLDEDDPDYEHHLLEALWLHQQHDRMDQELLIRLLRAGDPRARAAATRVLRYMRHRVTNPLGRLAIQAGDMHPRVRLEAVVAASFFDSAEAASVALEVLRQPTDKFLDYGLRETMRALEPRWKAAIREGQAIAAENSAGIEYLLDRVSPEELVNLPRVPTVLQALLTRHGVQATDRLEAAAELSRERGTTAVDEVLGAITRLDRNGGDHASHVLHELGALLRRGVPGSPPPARQALSSLAEEGRMAATRELGYASLVALDGSADGAWESASASLAGLESFLGGVPMIADSDLRAPLYARIRPLMFALPADLARDDASQAGGGTGLNVSYYDPPPRNAQLETIRELAVSETLRAPSFTLDLPPAKKKDAFGLLFTGTLFLPVSGSYTFYTSSDDGSRLYIGQAAVVANDGAHGMREKSGKIELGAGPHPIAVTYYDQGGAEGLKVSWAGPGFDKQEIPPEVLGGDRAASIRSRAILAMAHVPGHEQQKLQDAARFIGEGTFLDPAMELVRAVPRERWAPDQVRTVIETLAAYVSGLPAEQRTAPHVVAALEVGRELTSALSPEDAAGAREQLDGLGGSIILVRTVPHKMLYDVSEFWVEAGKPVAIVFQNNDVMPHNLVITRPGAMQVVGEAAELLSGAVVGQSFVPDTDDVLWHTQLLYPGESVRLTFVAPETVGEYPYVCTFPGHWRVMNGIMHVVDEIDEALHVVARSTDDGAAPAREFVKDWTMADLEPALGPGWDEGRSLERGRILFSDAGCLKCHTIAGEGAEGGPDLSKITEKYRGVDLLRTIVEPSAEILGGYFYHYIVLESGGDVIGRIVEDDGKALHVMRDLQKPDDIVIVRKDEIEAQVQTPLSPMPTGLLVTLTKGEILDLLAYLESGGE